MTPLKQVFFFVFFALYTTVGAQPETWYQKGKTLLAQKKYVEASNYLFAFLMSDSPSLKDANFRKQVREGYDFASAACSTALAERPVLGAELMRCHDDLVNCKNAGKGYAVASSGVTIEITPPDMPEIPQAPSYTTYPLLVKGGADYKVAFKSKSRDLDQPYLSISLPLKWTSAVGRQKENIGNMPDGSAAWLDRPISSDEPSVILFPVKLDDLVFKTVTSSMGFSMSRFSGSLELLNLLEKRGAYIEFSVYNDGKGNFIATGVSSSHKP